MMVLLKVFRPYKSLINNYSSAGGRERYFPRTRKFRLTKELPAERAKAIAKKRFNWINLKLYGPLLHNKTQDGSVNKSTVPMGRNIVLGKSSVLGNEKLNTRVIKENLGAIRPSANNFHMQDVFEVFISDKRYEYEFPFCNLSNYSKDDIKKASRNVLGFSKIEDELYSNMPTISSVLNDNSSKSQLEDINNMKLKLISQYGLPTFYAYQEEMLLIEAHLHKALQDYFNGIPLNNIHPDTVIAEHWNSLVDILPDISDVELMRAQLSHSYLLYSGFIDYVGKYKDHPVLIEVWIPDRLSSDSFANLQSIHLAVGNLGIYNAIYDDNKVKNILLITVDGCSPPKMFFFSNASCEGIWKHWIAILHSYWKRRRENPMKNYLNFRSK